MLNFTVFTLEDGKFKMFVDSLVDMKRMSTEYHALSAVELLAAFAMHAARPTSHKLQGSFDTLTDQDILQPEAKE